MKPDFNKGDGLLPAIIQHAESRQVLMLGYMSEEAFLRTESSGLVTFYSRSRAALWTKGETSGNFLHVQKMLLDCDGDTILVLALPDGPTCHTGTYTCFGAETAQGFLYQLAAKIDRRVSEGDESSYTSRLFARGINKIAQKVGEEAVELVIEAMDDNDDLFINEAADLLYHFLVLLRAKQVAITDVEAVLRSRDQKA